MRLPRLITLTGFLLINLGCTSTNISSTVAELGYIPMEPPREKFGVGTIIDVSDNSIVARADECVFRDNANIAKSKVAIPIKQKTTISAAQLDAQLPSVVKNIGKLAGILNSSIESAVTINLINPYTEAMSRFQLESYINGLDDQSLCKKFITSGDWYIIRETLGSEALDYQYQAKTNFNLDGDLDVSNVIEGNVKLLNVDENIVKLQVSGSYLVGYKTWKLAKSAALVGEKYQLIEVN